MSDKKFFQAAVLFTAAIFAGCTNDDATKLEGKSEQSTMLNSSVTFTSEVPAAPSVPSLRTIIAHSFGLGATPYWSVGDKIWVKDNGGQFQQSEAGTFNTAMTRGTFNVTGSFSNIKCNRRPTISTMPASRAIAARVQLRAAEIRISSSSIIKQVIFASCLVLQMSMSSAVSFSK